MRKNNLIKYGSILGLLTIHTYLWFYSGRVYEYCEMYYKYNKFLQSKRKY